MPGVFSTLLAPVLVLWIGAAVLYALDRFMKPRDAGLAETSVLSLSLGFLIYAHSRTNTPIQFGQFLAGAGWRGTAPFLVLSQTAWILALVLLGVAWAASLVSLGASLRGRAPRLAALAGALLFLFAGDWATLALAWVAVDVCMLAAPVEREEDVKQLGRAALLSLGGATLLGIALLLWQQAAGDVWVDQSGTLAIGASAATAFPKHVAGLLSLAALLRLMPFPLPTWQVTRDGERRQQELSLAQIVAFAVPALLGSYLWVRLAQWNVVSNAEHWPGILTLWAVLAMLVTAVKAWGAQEPDALLTCIVLYGAETILLAAGLQLPATHQLLVGMNALLSVSVLGLAWTQGQSFQIYEPRSYWRIVPAVVSLLSLAGLPLTIGFPARAALYRGIFAETRWLVLLLFMLTEALLLSAFVRIVLDVERAEENQDQEAAEESPADTDGMPEARWQQEIGFSAGALLALGTVLLGIAPRLVRLDGPLPGLGHWFLLPTLPVWAAMLLSVVASVAIYRSRDAILAPLQEWWPVLQRLFRFDWAFRLVEDLMRHVGALIWGGTRVVEGAGYMSWVVLACLVILLLVIAR